MRKFTKYPSNYVRATSYFYDETPVATDSEWELYAPATHEACRKLAGDTSWDFAARDPYWFDRCINRGPIYIFINKNTGEKYASCPAIDSWFYDAYDRNLGKQALGEFLDEHPKFVIGEFKDLLDEYGRNGWTWDTGETDDTENPGWFLSDRG